MHSLKHIREKAVYFREQGYTLPEICDRLKKGKSSVHYWIKNVEILKKNVFIKKCREHTALAQIKASEATRKKYKVIRDSYHKEAVDDSPEMFKNKSFRDFIILYITEGFRRTKGCLALGNSNPSIMRLFHYWVKELSRKKITYTLRIHEDHDSEESIKFWSCYLHVPKENVDCILKKNSCKMKTRNWRNEHGILTITSCDTYLKVKMDVYMKYLEEEWRNYPID